MPKFSRWKWILAFAATLAFAGAVGHESLHVEESDACKICHVQRHDAADLTAPVLAAVFAAVVFRILTVSFAPFAALVLPVRTGRAPPALSA